MAGVDVKVNGKEYFFTANGCEINVYEWIDNDLREIYDKKWLMSTPYEAIRIACSELWSDADIADNLTEEFGYELLTSDDAECDVCGEYSHYEEMIPDGQWGYVHEHCYNRAVA